MICLGALVTVAVLAIKLNNDTESIDEQQDTETDGKASRIQKQSHGGDPNTDTDGIILTNAS